MSLIVLVSYFMLASTREHLHDLLFIRVATDEVLLPAISD